MKDFLKKFNDSKINYLLLAFLIVMLVLEIINQRFWLNDFKVYYSAAENLKNNQAIYGQLFSLGSGYYKYSPFAAIVFIPFTYLNYFNACILFYFIIGISSIYIYKFLIFWVSENNIELSKQQLFKISILTFLFSAVHFQRELHLGNMNLILLSILLFIWQNFRNDKKILSSFLLAIVILFKPHFIVLLPLFIVRKEWKFLAFLFSSIILLFVFTFLFTGFNHGIQLLNDWKTTMMLHSSATSGNEQTIYYIINYHFLERFGFSGNLYITLSVLLLIGFSVLLFILFHLKSEKQNPDLKTTNFYFEYILLIGLVPNITVTDTEHFLYSLPMIFYVIYNLFRSGKSNSLKYLILIPLLGYGCKITGLIGNDLADIYLINSILGISNLLIIVWFVLFTYKNKIAD